MACVCRSLCLGTDGLPRLGRFCPKRCFVTMTLATVPNGKGAMQQYSGRDKYVAAAVRDRLAALAWHAWASLAGRYLPSQQRC